jgi:hypothetical protein
MKASILFKKTHQIQKYKMEWMSCCKIPFQIFLILNNNCITHLLLVKILLKDRNETIIYQIVINLIGNNFHQIFLKLQAQTNKLKLNISNQKIVKNI